MARSTTSTKPREVTRLATIARRDGTEQLRLSCDEFFQANGEPSRYVNARVWFRARKGDWKPSKSGLTIRARAELAEVIEALQRALSAMGDEAA